MANIIDFDQVATLKQALAASRLLQGLSDGALTRISERAQKRIVPDGEEIALGDDEPMLVVLSGTLQVSVAAGPTMSLNSGGILNEVGMLGIAHQAEAHKPTIKSAPDPTRGTPAKTQHFADIYASTGSSEGADPKKQSVNIDKTRTILNLCPHAPVQLTADNCGQKLSGWLRLSVVAGVACEMSGAPATLAEISNKLIKDTLAAYPKCAETFLANQEVLTSSWLVILRSFVFPGAPPEVAWALAGVSQKQEVPAGEFLVTEGEAGDACESLLVIEDGEATVEKLMAKGGKANPSVVGELARGAIIGDVCFVGAKVPRVASVRAKSNVIALTLPMHGLLSVLSRFPGVIACMKSRLRETAMLLQPSLPARSEVLAMMQIFSKCSQEFIREIVACAERHMFYCGDVIKAEGTEDATFCVAEFGLCSVEKKGKGVVDYVHMNSCFGERTLLGTSTTANATVRVASPLALMLTIHADHFNSILAQYPKEQRRLEQGAKAGLARGSDTQRLEVLRRCSAQFIEAIVGSIEMRCYMPGQTITVEQAIDAGSMFVVKGGRAAVEIKGVVVKILPAGEAFGELAMLGLVRRRTSTVRAVQLCFLFEIPRASFLAALDQHPEEKAHFEDLSTKGGVVSSSIHWPIFQGAPARLMYLVNLYAERRITPVGAWTSRNGDPLTRDAAVLLLQGTIRVENSEGQEVDELTEGSCFNEQILLGHDSNPCKLVPKMSCEVQIMRKEVYDKIMAEFRDQNLHDSVRQRIVDEMAGKAESKLGLARGTADVLRLSALFRAVPEAFAAHVRKRLSSRVYNPGEYITRAGEKGDSMYIVLSGETRIDATDGGEPIENVDTRVFGEAVVLKIASHHSLPVKASSHCVAHQLTISCLEESLLKFPTVRKLFEDLCTQNSGQMLRERLHQNSLLSQAGQQFVSIACEHADDVFFAPGDEILKKGDVCKFGVAAVYVLISGRASVEADFDIMLGSIGPGEVFGEGGGLGIADIRGATVRAYKGGLTHCARLHGSSLKSAVEAFPNKYPVLLRLYQERQEANAVFAEKRRQWLENTVVPALARSSVFAGFHKELLSRLAMPLEAVKYKSGQTICEAGEAADSMVVLVEGEAVVESKLREVVGRYTDGAVFGEVAVLGLLPVRTATVRATCDCQVLMLSSNVITQVLAGPVGSSVRQAFESLPENRRLQAAAGIPICTLPIDVPLYDVCARAVALQAERIDLLPGELWWPISDTSPSGHHVTVFVQGRGSLLVGEDIRPVMNLLAGFVLPEGLAFDNNAHVRAVTTCEIYRIRMVDFVLAVHAHPAAKKWFARFEEIVSAAKQRLTFRLESASGAAASRVKKLKDHDLSRFKLKDQRATAIMAQTLQDFGLGLGARLGTRSKSCSSVNPTGKSLLPRPEPDVIDVISPSTRESPAVNSRVGSPQSDTGLSSAIVKMPPINGKQAWKSWGVEPPGNLCLTLCGLNKKGVKSTTF